MRLHPPFLQSLPPLGSPRLNTAASGSSRLLSAPLGSSRLVRLISAHLGWVPRPRRDGRCGRGGWGHAWEGSLAGRESCVCMARAGAAWKPLSAHDASFN